MGFKHKQVIMLAFGHAVEYVIDEFVTATHIQPRTRFWNLDSKWHGILRFEARCFNLFPYSSAYKI